MSQIQMEHNEIIAILGRRKKGKSNYLLYLIFEFIRNNWPVILIDTEHEYDSLIKSDPLLEIFQPQGVKAEKIKQLEEQCEKAVKQESCVIAIESIDFYTSPKKDLPYWLSEIVHHGRKRRGDEKRGIGLIITARRISNCNNDPFALANHTIIFNTTWKNDLKRLKENIGDIGEEAKNLKPHYYIYYSDSFSFISDRKVPKMK